MDEGQHQPVSRAGTLPLIGGVLALDFCNTSSGRGTDAHIEHLHGVANLLAWAHHAGIVDEGTQSGLRELCRDEAGRGARLLARALALRDALHDLLAALARGGEPDQGTVDRVAGEHAACLAKGRLTVRAGAFGWSWTVPHAPDEVILGPIAASGMALLAEADRARLKRCEGHNCGWLFLDTTKSNNRRWCEMEPCGNRAKQTRRRGRLRSPG